MRIGYVLLPSLSLSDILADRGRTAVVRDEAPRGVGLGRPREIRQGPEASREGMGLELSFWDDFLIQRSSSVPMRPLHLLGRREWVRPTACYRCVQPCSAMTDAVEAGECSIISR